MARNRILTLETQNLMIAITLAKLIVIHPVIIAANDYEALIKGV